MRSTDEPIDRRTLLAGLTAGSALPALAAPAASDAPSWPRDIGLVELAIALHAADAASRAAVARFAAAERTGDDAAVEAAEAEVQRAADEVEGVILRIAATPAEGLMGLCIKAGRLCRSLVEDGDLLDAEVALAESLLMDCRRFAPATWPP